MNTHFEETFSYIFGVRTGTSILFHFYVSNSAINVIIYVIISSFLTSYTCV